MGCPYQTYQEKIIPTIGVLNRLRGIIPANCLRMIYFSLVHSHLQYMNIIWSCCTKGKITEMQTIQNKAIRALYGFAPLTSRKYMYTFAGIMPLFMNIKASLIQLAFKIKRGHTRTEIVSKFANNSDIHHHYTRQSNLLHVPRVKTEKYGRKGILYKAILAYNSTPIETIECVSESSFKRKLKSYLWYDFTIIGFEHA